MDDFTFPKNRSLIRYAFMMITLLAALMFGFLALMIVPAPGAGTAQEISGTVQFINPPHPQTGDMNILLEDGHRFYVNRAKEVDGFAWERVLAEIEPGSTIFLTVVTPYVWRLIPFEERSIQPVAGIRTEDTVYLNAAQAAKTWTAQAAFSRLTVLALITLLMTLLPDLKKLFKHRSPTAPSAI